MLCAVLCPVLYIVRCAVRSVWLGVLLGALLCIAPAQAQGIPVIDVANLTQAVQNVLDDAERYEQLAQTVAQLRSTYASLTGVRNLAAALNNPLLQNYLPPASYTLLDQVTAGGYGALTPRAQALRDALMLYNCLERTGRAQSSCQASLSAPYQYKALINDAQDRSSQRTVQINALMRQAGATLDPKAIAEAQARIQAEIALLHHEATQAQLAAMAADADGQVRASRGLEAQLANLVRPIR
jgi:type IV secretion system protein VirB5